MSVEDLADHIRRVDRLVLKGQKVPEDDLKMNISDLYSRYRWGGAGPTPFSNDAVKRLGLVEKTTDPRWLTHFDGHGRHVGVYRSDVGYYWLLRFDPGLRQHHLEHAGTAADVNENYGT